LSLKCSWIKDTSVLDAKEKLLKIVGCAKIAIISSSAKNVLKIELISKVCTLIHIKNIMFSLKFFDVYINHIESVHFRLCSSYTFNVLIQMNQMIY
jgi:hypothetical protein